MKIVFLAAAASFLSLVVGCGQQPRYGNFTTVDSQSLVNDAVAMMLATYPPAHTRLNMLHDADDAWGDKFIRALRTHGYAVSEFSPRPVVKDKYSENGVGFAFILDEYRAGKEYSLTLFIGNDRMGRSYAVRGSGESQVFVGLGHWARRR